MADFYTEGLYTAWPGDDQGDYDFAIGSYQSTEYLILKSVAGRDMSMTTYSDAASMLYSLKDDELLQLWKVVRSMDVDVTQAKLDEELEFQTSNRRMILEDMGELAPMAAAP